MSIALRNSCGTDAVCQQPTRSFILPVPAGGSSFRPGLFFGGYQFAGVRNICCFVNAPASNFLFFNRFPNILPRTTNPL